MRAAVYMSADVPLVIERVDDPTPKAGQAILQVAGAGICGSDLHLKQLNRLPSGTIFGHEFAGSIVALGADMDGWAIGESVTALPVLSCKNCAACDADLPSLCAGVAFIGTRPDKPGAYAEYVAVDRHMLQRLPQGVSFSEGAMVEPLAVAHHAVEMAGVNSGSTVLIMGIGPIGAATALFARMKGARHVVVSEPSPDRRALAIDLGATAVIDPKNEDVAARFAAITGRAPEIVFECVGNPGLLKQAIGLAGMRGQVIVAGVCMGEDAINPMVALGKEVTLKFSQAYGEGDFAAVIDAIARRRIDVAPMHSRSVGFADFPAAFEELGKAPKDCKILLDPSLS
ncbi:zinc-dependent alcohol dehydrogenase [Sphingomonas montanisoli]|uniref:Alcohol dehydrogenase catalytic domain-containing protein n=1 Tax=Sphingomonas montanisoli TaxID=2606412 RepID=A0A5D9CBG2_9SPHN|nr:alcohol dehydrogenase catalytic domain-containing protein [Sphingomonas montanisoli]TZG29069.1 alcohol dehydrogenase catalytic domain-containing protein [Sphingomonas montanisoli]